MLSLLQREAKIRNSDHGKDGREINIAPTDSEGMQQAVLMDAEDDPNQIVNGFDEELSFYEHYTTNEELTFYEHYTKGKMLQECNAKLVRFTSLNMQANWPAGVEPDPLFPNNQSSIAAPGTSCGDTAQGIDESCAKFNQWRTFQQVQGTEEIKVMGPSGITFDDIAQGELGNCYFLAALAAIAATQPDIIKNMFVETELWDLNIYKTKWLINGKESILSVDNLIPANDDGAFFTQPSRTGEYWPVILGKTWAKVFGNFKAVEGGDSGAVIKAMTRAPGRYLHIQEKSEDDIWKILMEGGDNKYPMSAGTCGDCEGPRKFRMANGHSYAILKPYIHGKYGKVVKMYNPWSVTNFAGSIPQEVELNGNATGVFTMNMTEFYTAYQDMTINYVIPGYKVSHKTQKSDTLTAHNFTVGARGKFWVEMVWPSRRMVAPCPHLNPAGFIEAQSTEEPGTLVTKVLERFADDNDMAAEIENPNGGSYDVMSNAKFREDASWITEVEFTVYAPEVVNIVDFTEGADTLALQIGGPLKSDGSPCDFLTIPGRGLFSVMKSRPNIEGIPTYWDIDMSTFLYHVDSANQWWLIKASYYDKILEGRLYAFDNGKYEKRDLKCGCEDDPQGVTGFGASIPCAQATDTNYMYANVKCTMADYSTKVQMHCPVSCGTCPGSQH